jgi:hypothetical protein
MDNSKDYNPTLSGDGSSPKESPLVHPSLGFPLDRIDEPFLLQFEKRASFYVPPNETVVISELGLEEIDHFRDAKMTSRSLNSRIQSLRSLGRNIGTMELWKKIFQGDQGIKWP